MIANNNEEKRSKIWRIVTVTATIVILLVVVFFLINLYTANPLEGTWQQKDKGLSLAITGKSTLTAKWDVLLESNNVKVKMGYSLDRETKTFTIKVDDAELARVAKGSKGQFTKEALKSAVSTLATGFDYSVDGKKLTLTEREYGEQMIFIKK